MAIRRAVEKLQALGPALAFPHQSGVKAGMGLRELRPRGGRSVWRPLYRQIGHMMVVVALAPRPRGIHAASREPFELHRAELRRFRPRAVMNPNEQTSSSVAEDLG